VTPTARYKERLLPQWWAVLTAVALVLMLAVAYGAALGRSAGLTVGIGGMLLALWLLWITSPVVQITSDTLLVAAARLPLDAVGAVRAVDRADIAALRGPGADARLFVALRPWSAGGGVLVEVDDPQDPHPGWLFSSRHPARIVSALTATM
jgi:hypothetical protein